MDLKNILIIGPFGLRGGREIEVSFIAKFLSEKHIVEVLTTGVFFENSDVLSFCKKVSFKGIDKQIYSRNLLLRFVIFLLNLYRNLKIPKHHRVSNKWVKFFLNISRKRDRIIKKEILKNDIIFICAQLSSSYLEQIINYSYKNNKKILFRTTGTISNIIKERLELFKKVDCFIHHSYINTNHMEKFYGKHSYKIIDQCTAIEGDLLKINFNKGKIKNYLVLSRLSKEKQVDKVITAFKRYENKTIKLFIYGDGDLKNNLLKQSKGDSRIYFKGYVHQDKLPLIFEKSDCLIISSLEETGPITGVEAMAAGKTIISTRVGAMEERLDNDCFWYDGSELELEKMFRMISNKENGRYIYSKINREKYLKKLCQEKVKKQYLESIDFVFN